VWCEALRVSFDACRGVFAAEPWSRVTIDVRRLRRSLASLVFDEVCGRHALPVGGVCSVSRRAELVACRMELAWALRVGLGLSGPETAVLLRPKRGRRRPSHSSVADMLRRVRESSDREGIERRAAAAIRAAGERWMRGRGVDLGEGVAS
jgi:hypothetical protein